MPEIDGMYFYISEESARSLMKAYEQNPNKIPDLPAINFAHNVDWRLYTEWCFNMSWEAHRRYAGQGFNDFMANETHYALERQGFRWDQKQKQFSETGSNGQHISQAYPRTIEAVLRALTDQSIEFFKKCEGYWNVRSDNPENLRVSLKLWMHPLEPSSRSETF